MYQAIITMSIKINKRSYSPDVVNDLNNLLVWIKKQSSDKIYTLQEIIFNTIRILTNDSYRQNIALLRKAFGIPRDFYTSGRVKNDEYYEEWLNQQADSVPVDPWHKEIADLCQKHNLNPDRYGEFVLNYLYFSEVTPVGELVTLENTLSTDEPKYKSRIICKYKDKAELPEGLYIQLYKDTTINQLHEYINKNQRIIWFLQKLTLPYSKIRNRKWWMVKRDIEIFLYHETGMNAPKIREKIAGDFLTEEDTVYDQNKYILDDSTVRTIVSDIYKTVFHSSDR